MRNDRRQQLAELALVKTRQAMLQGPSGLARLTGFEPMAYQREMFESTAQFVHAVTCRQAGKSTGGGLVALHAALKKPRQHVLFFGAKQAQAGEILVRLREHLSAMPIPPETPGDSKTALEFRNGSRVVCFPSRVPEGGTIRGPSPDLIVHDEAAFAPEGLFNATLPMVARSRGRIFYLSTPNGTHSAQRPNFFHRATLDFKGDPAWRFITAPWDSLPEGTFAPGFIERARLALGVLFEQEFCCQFIREGVGLVWSAFSRGRNVIPSLPVNSSETPWRWILGVDPSGSGLTGYCLCAFRAHDPCLYVTEACAEKGVSPGDFARKIRHYQSRVPVERVIMDTGGLGKAFELEFVQRQGIWVNAADKSKKASYIHTVNGMFASSFLKILADNQELIGQLENLPWNDDFTNHRKGSPADQCVAEGTLVETEFGPVPVEGVRSGDMVWTRAGLRRVLRAWCTGENPVFAVETESGRRLVGTLDHPVWTDSGWQSLGLLDRGCTLSAWVSGGSQRPSCSKASSSGGIRTHRAWSTGGISGAPARRPASSVEAGPCTAQSGFDTTARSRQGTMSIIGTRTPTTTTSPTLSASPAGRMWPSTGPQGRTMGSSASIAARSMGESPPQLLTSGGLPGFAPRGVSARSMRTPAELRERTMRTGFVLSAAGRSASTSTPLSSAVPDRVVRVVPTGRARTYDLEVEGVHEFVASGLVVSNCDAMLYVARDAMAYLAQPAREPLPQDEWIRKREQDDIEARKREIRSTGQDMDDVGERFDGMDFDGGFDDPWGA